MPDEATATAALTWAEIVEHCSRLHTTRTRPEGPWEDAAPREDSRMLDVWVNYGFPGGEPIPVTVVPTRMHEPGFYVRGEYRGSNILMRSPEELDHFRALVNAGKVSRRDA